MEPKKKQKKKSCNYFFLFKFLLKNLRQDIQHTNRVPWSHKVPQNFSWFYKHHTPPPLFGKIISKTGTLGIWDGLDWKSFIFWSLSNIISLNNAETLFLLLSVCLAAAVSKFKSGELKKLKTVLQTFSSLHLFIVKLVDSNPNVSHFL